MYDGAKKGGALIKAFSNCQEAVIACQTSKRFSIALLSNEEKPRSMHHHDCLELYYSVAGGKQFFVDTRLYDHADGDLFIINQFETHKPVLAEGAHHERIVLSIHPDYPAQLSTPDTDLTACFYERPPGFSHRVSLNRAERTQFNALVRKCISAQGYGADVQENTSFTELLLLVSGLYTPEHAAASAALPIDTTSSGGLVSDILTYVNQRITEPLSIDTLAEAFFLSRGYICRLFKQETGTTIIKYIAARRISVAKRLLAEGCTVHEACERSGFGDYAHFIRVFGQAVGVSPKQYALRFI